MQHLVFVRHGESELNVLNKQTRIYCGQFDTRLTELGRRQALAAAEKIRGLAYLRLARAIASPLHRACETLELMLTKLPMEICRLPPSPGLKERSLGLFEGRPEEEVFKEYPLYRDDPNFNCFANHFEQCAPEGENLTVVSERAWPVVQQLAEAEGDVLIVSHYNTIRCILGRALNLKQEQVLKMRVRNAEPIVLRKTPRWELIEGLPNV